MPIFKSYIKDGIPVNNRFKYSDAVNIGNEPIIQKDIPMNLRSKVPTSNQASKRIDDLVRITTLLTQPPGLKFIANETALYASKDKRSTADRIRTNTSARPSATETLGNLFKRKIVQLGTNLIGGVGQTVKTVASTLAQVPVNGTGTHFVKGFNGVSKQTYLSGMSTAPHTLVRQGSKVYTENTALDAGAGNETVGGQKINTDKRLEGTETLTGLKAQEGGDLEGNIVGNVKSKLENIAKQASDKLASSLPGKFLNTAKSVFKDTRISLGDISKRDSEDRKEYGAPFDSTVSDGINMLDPYSGQVESLDKTRDIIKFRFNIITPEDNTYLHFRAFLTSFDDNFDGSWNQFSYNGRAENFYTYSGFERNINIGFRIAAQTRYEMKPLYKKMVLLASSTAPTYNNEGVMRGTFVKATVGDYIYEMPGFISNVNYAWDQAYPWEIAIDAPEGGKDAGMQELPMVMDCSLSFTVIHRFAPQTGLNHYITNPFMKQYFNARGEEPVQTVSAINAKGVTVSKFKDLIGSKKIGSVEVGKGAFGGSFDQGDFVDLDQFKSTGR